MAWGDHKGSLTASLNSITNPVVYSGSVVVAVGDLVFGGLGQQTALTAAGTVTDNLGNTYQYTNAGTDAGNATGRAFWSRVTVAGTLTTINVPATASANDASGVASVVEGPFTTSPLDANPANTTDGTSPHACPATGVLAQADEVVMAFCALAANIAMNATSPGVITQTVARANISTAVQRRVVSATTSVTPEFGNGATANAVQITASFKQAPVHNLTATNLTTAGAELGTPSIGQTHGLTASGLTPAGAELGTSTLGQTHVLGATGITTAPPELGTPGQLADVLTASNLTTGAPELGTPTLGGTHLLDADDLTAAGASLGTPSIGQTHGLVSATLTTSGPSFGQPPIGQTHVLVAVDIETLWPDIDDAILDGAVPEAPQIRRRKFSYDYAYTNDRWSE